MNIEMQIRAWKDPDFRGTLDKSEVLAHPSGDRLVELDTESMASIFGGHPSEGFVCTVSGECNGSRSSCW